MIGKPSEMVTIDTLVARDILSKLKLSARQMSRDLGKSANFISTILRRGEIRERDIALIKRVFNVDLTPCIITQEKPEQIEMQMADTNSTDDLCNVIRESSNSLGKQSAVNVAGIVDSINELTNAVKELNNNLNANFDGQYKILDGMRMKLEKIKKY